MENLDLFAADAGGGGRVDEIAVNTFGVNWPLFISQCIAFLIVAFPVEQVRPARYSQVLEDRKKRIAESMENAEKIETEWPPQTKKDEILSQGQRRRQTVDQGSPRRLRKCARTENQKAIKQAEADHCQGARSHRGRQGRDDGGTARDWPVGGGDHGQGQWQGAHAMRISGSPRPPRTEGSKQSRRDAKQLFQSCQVDGARTPPVALLIEKKPRAVLSDAAVGEVGCQSLGPRGNQWL